MSKFNNDVAMRRFITGTRVPLNLAALSDAKLSIEQIGQDQYLIAGTHIFHPVTGFWRHAKEPNRIGYTAGALIADVRIGAAMRP